MSRLPIRRIGARLAAVALGLLSACLLLELTLRMAYPLLPYPLQAALREVHRTPFTNERILPEQIWQVDGNFQFISRAKVTDELQFPDPRIGFHVTTQPLLDPNSYVGFRVPSPDWEPRWPIDAVMVGDSFTFCYTEYADCWVRRLSEEHGLSVVNLGQVATGSTSHLNILRTFGMPFEPNLVIWQWFGNDFNDDYGMAVLRDEIPGESYLPPQVTWEPKSTLGRWLREHSALYVTVETLTYPDEVLQGYTLFSDPYQVQDGDLNFSFGRPYLLEAFDMTQAKNQYGWERTQEAIIEAQAMIGQKASLVIVLIPTKEEVYRRWTQGELGTQELDALGEGRHLMLAFCETQGLLCLDTTASLVEHAEQGELLYWPDDPHLNEYGNEVLAETIWDCLVRHGLASSD